jgi:hypothetical protein
LVLHSSMAYKPKPLYRHISYRVRTQKWDGNEVGELGLWMLLLRPQV